MLQYYIQKYKWKSKTAKHVFVTYQICTLLLHTDIFSLCLPLQTFSHQHLEKMRDLERCWKTAEAECARGPVQNTCKKRLNNSESRKFIFFSHSSSHFILEWCSAEHLMPGTTTKAKSSLRDQIIPAELYGWISHKQNLRTCRHSFVTGLLWEGHMPVTSRIVFKHAWYNWLCLWSVNGEITPKPNVEFIWSHTFLAYILNAKTHSAHR